jgi:CelD/BcsL family acetyltransferase involved in cellulose biosynthesis
VISGENTTTFAARDVGVPYRVSAVEPAQWDALVQAFPDRTVFHGLAWLRSVAQAESLELILRKVESDGRCLAIWPWLEVRKGPLRVLGSPLPGWSTVYLGPLFDRQANVADCVRAFCEDPRLRTAAYSYCKVLDPGREVDLGPAGFEVRSGYRTYLLSLERSEAELWSNLEGNCRTKIRKGLKQGLEVRRETDSDFIEDFWTMSLEVFGRSGIRPTFSRRLLELVVGNLMAEDRLLVLSAFWEGRRIATLVHPHDDQTLYNWQGTSFGEYRWLSPNNLLQWEAILAARRMGLRRFDFVSVYGGPGEFKKSFGGTATTTATHWERYRWPVVRVLKQTYEYYLRRRQRAR